MRYFKILDAFGNPDTIGTGFGGVEISKEKYRELLAEFLEKFRLADELWAGAITEADIPAQWREEIIRQNEERMEIVKSVHATEADFISALEELGVTIHEES